MDVTGYKVRRATVDDLPILRAMWEKAEFPSEDLERVLTQFQVAEGAEGVVHAALAFTVDKQQGLVHSDMFVRQELENLLYPLFWARIQSLAKYHSINRLWTLVRHPFLLDQGFKEASARQLEKLPGPFGNPQAHWLTLSLRDETVSALTIEKELELFARSQQENNARIMRQAKTLKIAALVFAVVVAVGIAVAAGYIYKNYSRIQIRR